MTNLEKSKLEGNNFYMKTEATGNCKHDGTLVN